MADQRANQSPFLTRLQAASRVALFYVHDLQPSRISLFAVLRTLLGWPLGLTAAAAKSVLPFTFYDSPRAIMDAVSSHIPRASRNLGLVEMKPAETNVRANKHHIANLPEPPAKRKTLAERAGEPISASSSIIMKAAASSIPIGAIQSQKTSSLARTASQSYRSNSAASRSTSNTSFSSSVGPSGLRQPSNNTNMMRPRTAFGGSRVAGLAESRTAGALEAHAKSQDAHNKREQPPIIAPYLAVRRPSAANDARVMPPPFRIPFPRMATLPSVIAATRDSSISTRMAALSLESKTSKQKEHDPFRSVSPSKLPRPMTPARQPSPSPPKSRKSCQNPLPKFRQFLTKDSTTEAWDVDQQFETFERMHKDIMDTLNQSLNESTNMKSTLTMLEKDRAELTEALMTLRGEVQSSKISLAAAEHTNESIKASYETEISHLKEKVEEIKSDHGAFVDTIREETRRQLEAREAAEQQRIEQVKQDYQEIIRGIKKDSQDALENERSLRIQTVSQVSTAEALQKQKHEIELAAKEQTIRQLKEESDREKSLALDFHSSANMIQERQKAFITDLQSNISTVTANAAALQAKIEYLESDNKTQSESYAAMERQMQDAIDRAAVLEEKLRKAETLRRKQHDKIQQLSGNIRVICRTRPALESDSSAELATMDFPDTEENKQIEVKGPEERSSLGSITTKTYPFSFDRSFDPSSNNQEIFEEISPLIQSSVDGYNVCVFAYGQTGAGKTYTMSSVDGMIPRALRQIYDTTKSLEERGWTYTIQGSFVEVYNENINDLLGNSEEMDKKKHEVRHDMQKCETTITGVTVVDLDSPQTVESLLEQAMSKRSVAATKLNERSSRSHSIFILKLSGVNHMTGEASKGTLNLVDLAGSERVSHSKVEGARLKETQNINKSLSCLGDVIGALGSKDPGAHIPYRNSKLTYLLQFSLGGNSKTLMFVMVSPLKDHLSETLSSLKFATKVNTTHIGVAKRASK